LNWKNINRQPRLIHTSKAESIISLISLGTELKEVAQKKGFRDAQELADYMKSQGYIWSSSEKNYALVPQEKLLPPPPQKPVLQVGDGLHRDDCGCLERYVDVLRFLDENKDKLAELFDGQSKPQGQFPRYLIQGSVITKSVKMVSSLERLMNDFCELANITQKAFLC
jgi:hypothetical protein